MSKNTNEILSLWPKKVAELNERQLEAREGFMRGWLELLPNKYGVVEKFNQGWVAKLPLPTQKIKTLEIGAGLGEHASWEDLSNQDYYHLDYRKEFTDLLAKKFGDSQSILADIQEKVDLPAESYDRIVALHVLEHLPSLVKAVVEIVRLLKKDGFFDVVIPCEGGLAYGIARKISAQRYFEKRFKMDYIPIVKTEHVNMGYEIVRLLELFFNFETSSFFPLKVPVFTMNLCYGMRLRRRSEAELRSTFEEHPHILERIFESDLQANPSKELVDSIL